MTSNLFFVLALRKTFIFAYREIVFNSKPLNDEQLAELEFYQLVP